MRPCGAAEVPRDSPLPAEWFAFIAGWTIRKAFRRSEYISLISIGARREFAGWNIDLQSKHLVGLMRTIVGTIRETDLIGELADGSLGILISDVDEPAVCRLVQRLIEALTTIQPSAPLTFAIGSGTCPIHGVDLPALFDHATTHPVLNIRVEPTPADRPYDLDVRAIV